MQMHVCSQNTAFFYIDDHELTSIKGKRPDFSVEITLSITLQLSLLHSSGPVCVSRWLLGVPDNLDQMLLSRFLPRTQP